MLHYYVITDTVSLSLCAVRTHAVPYTAYKHFNVYYTVQYSYFYIYLCMCMLYGPWFIDSRDNLSIHVSCCAVYVCRACAIAGVRALHTGAHGNTEKPSSSFSLCVGITNDTEPPSNPPPLRPCVARNNKWTFMLIATSALRFEININNLLRKLYRCAACRIMLRPYLVLGECADEHNGVLILTPYEFEISGTVDVAEPFTTAASKPSTKQTTYDQYLHNERCAPNVNKWCIEAGCKWIDKNISNCCGN